jgi:hypothetical protein
MRAAGDKTVVGENLLDFLGGLAQYPANSTASYPMARTSARAFSSPTFLM